MRDISPVIFIGDLAGLQHDHRGRRASSRSAPASPTPRRSRRWRKRIPALGPLFDRIGGEQVRNMGTIGGNIANGSPIGDTPPPLIALGAQLTLRQGNEAARRSRSRTSSSPMASRTGSRASSSRPSHVPVPAKGDAVRRLQDHQAPRRGHHRRARRLLPDARQGRHGRGRSASPLAAWRRRRSAPPRSKQALLGKPWTEATVEAAMAGLRQRISRR